MKSKPFLREILNFSISNASDFFSCTTMKSKNGWFTSSSCDCRKIKNIISSIFFKDFHWKKVIAELDIVHQQTMFQLVSVEKQKTLVNFLFTRVYLHLFVPRPGTSHRNHRKIKEFIFLIINYLNISYFLYFCHILPIFRYSVHF